MEKSKREKLDSILKYVLLSSQEVSILLILLSLAFILDLASEITRGDLDWIKLIYLPLGFGSFYLGRELNRAKRETIDLRLRFLTLPISLAFLGYHISIQKIDFAHTIGGLFLFLSLPLVYNKPKVSKAIGIAFIIISLLSWVFLR